MLQQWFHGLRRAWDQAKDEYQSSSRQQKHKQTSRRRADQNRKAQGRSVSAVGRSVRSGKKNLGDQSGINTTSSRQQPIVTTSHAPEHVSSYNATLLDDDFLKDIRAEGSQVDMITRTEPALRLKGDIALAHEPTDTTAAFQENDKYLLDKTVDETAHGSHMSKRRLSASITLTEIDEEYILRVEQKVRRLERELEQARARLSIYERSERLPKKEQEVGDGTVLPADDEVAMQTSSHHPKSTTKSPRQGLTDAAYATTDVPVQANIIRPSLHETPAKSLYEEAFVLSPVGLEFSPVRIEQADLSNGEIARKEAVNALKERVKQSSAHFDLPL